jgi:hypothetical protein
MPKTRPKDIGTRGERTVVDYLNANGFAQAERRALHGNTDLGDITGIPGVVIEVKAGEQTLGVGPGSKKAAAWIAETETERANAGAEIGILVLQRHHQNVRNWWAVLTANNHQRLMGYSELADTPLKHMAFWCQLESVTMLLRHYGHGDRIDWEQLA